MPEKSKLILMHGALGAGSQLTSIQSSLSDYFDVKILEFEGHGEESHKTPDLSLENFSAQLSKMASSDPARRPHVFGYSLGGYVALYSARNHPGLLGRIITLGTKFDWKPNTVDEQFGFLNAQKIKNEIPQLQQSLIQLHGHAWENLVTGTCQFIEQLGKNPPIDEPFCTHIQNQVLILRGDKDKMVSEAESASVASWLPHGEFITLTETTHPIERVDLEKISKAIKDFLSIDSNGEE